MTSITPFLWFDNNVPEAVAFYKSVFPNAKVETVIDFMATFELEEAEVQRSQWRPKI
jgi:predicted 3-demethylubiquinone-9 3-methyltransferase (glyoxalase superfamily)